MRHVSSDAPEGPDIGSGDPVPELLDAISSDPAGLGTFKRLISEGCAPWNLLWFLNGCVAHDQVSALMKEQLGSLKIKFDGLIRRLGTLSAKILDLKTVRILDRPLRESLAFDSIDHRVGTEFARNYLFGELPGSMKWAKAFLKELKQNLAEEDTVRLQTRGTLLAYLYLYCCASTGRQITYREIADLLSAGSVVTGIETETSEATVRMALSRFKRSAAAMSYELLESLMKDYARSCPTGSPTFDVWFKHHGAGWISSHSRPLCPGRIISEKERRILTLKERERLKKRAVRVLDGSCAPAA